MLLSERILYIDGDAIVIDKPAGLPVDPPRSGGSSVEGRAAELRMGFRTSPVAMHRIDTDTTGCLLLARNARARREFQAAFEGREVKKTYLAVVEGVVPDDKGVIDLPVAKVSTAATGWRMVVDQGGKSARTHWRRIGTIEEKSLVEFQPETGRTHQIRLHAARGLGTAIVGDPMYSDRDADPEQPMLLHAWKLRVERGKKPAIDVVAPIPDAFGLFLDFLAEDESAA